MASRNEQSKNRLVSVRLSESTKRWAEVFADERHMTLSAWCNLAIQAAVFDAFQLREAEMVENAEES